MGTEIKRNKPVFRLRDFSSSEMAKIIEFNNAEVPHVGHLTMAELKTTAAEAYRFLVAENSAGETAGFVLALDQTATYKSLNFRWFQARYPKFVYVDRIVVLKPFKGQGIGRLFYDGLAQLANASYPIITCEVNLLPPNPDSMAFHTKLGFREVGQQTLAGGKKKVSMLIKDIGD